MTREQCAETIERLGNVCRDLRAAHREIPEMIAMTLRDAVFMWDQFFSSRIPPVVVPVQRRWTKSGLPAR